MKKLIIFLMLFISIGVNATTYYVCTQGKDTNNGTTLTTPFFNLQFAFNKLQPGDILYVRGGTYRSTLTASANKHLTIIGKNGTSAKPIVIMPYQSELPVFDLAYLGNSTASYVIGLSIENSNYITIKGFEIGNILQNKSGATVNGVDIRNSNNITLENINLHHIGGYGFTIQPGCSNILYKNCDAHHCLDQYPNPGNNSAYENANGFGVTGGDGTDYAVNNSTNITYDGCRAWNNADDGWDFFGANGFITVKNCWSFYNGYDDNFNRLGDGNGFKMGPFITDFFSTHKRDVFNNIAVRNSSTGFTENFAQGLGTGIFHVYNNVAYANGTVGMAFNTDFLKIGPAHIIRNNIQYANINPWTGGCAYPGTIQDHNSWNSLEAVPTDFINLDYSQLVMSRKIDGSIPDVTFMLLSDNSKYIDKGVDVGLPFLGKAPDVGWKEKGTVVTPPTPTPVPSDTIVIKIQIIGKDIKVTTE